MKDTQEIINTHKKFIQTICETETVFALQNKEEFAITYSHNYEDEEGDPVQIICFWSEENLAKACINHEWTAYKLYEIDLADFMENWCVGIDMDGLMAGTDFDGNLNGYEADSLEMILEIITTLKKKKKAVKLTNYKSIEELETQVKNALYGE
ncbi:DUF2750 domain-containing protein [Flavobacterium sp.]|uniref:DUF2750 domain-containing protein n=1 Tax=Flavobacterium sp. TaxID=239 RepID=UPI003D0B51E4